ncbi:hypothetical protein INR49_032263 [Caranx melampygus]|nr:hypothetical protein INR49_032263 [Caranx melampygus]
MMLLMSLMVICGKQLLGEQLELCSALFGTVLHPNPCQHHRPHPPPSHPTLPHRTLSVACAYNTLRRS